MDQFGLGPDLIDETIVVSQNLSSEEGDDSQTVDGTRPADE